MSSYTSFTSRSDAPDAPDARKQLSSIARLSPVAISRLVCVGLTFLSANCTAYEVDKRFNQVVQPEMVNDTRCLLNSVSLLLQLNTTFMGPSVCPSHSAHASPHSAHISYTSAQIGPKLAH